MNLCESIRSQFPEYLDGVASGVKMLNIARHLEVCGTCSQEFAEEEGLQKVLASIPPVKLPPDLNLRLRVAVSHEKARTARRRLDVWQMHWQNSIGPFLARAGAGMASAAILLGAFALMVGTVAAPPTLAANDAVTDTITSPHLLYTSVGTDFQIASRTPILVEANVSNTGRVYSYRIVSGPQSKAVRQELENILLLSQFTPAMFYGTPVHGRAILSFSGVSVRG
ncbi:MAG TPA: zf-HC2 domain-containing protein [Acidobacteriaceae bacterium]|nr:zf-HC2 domain-containing protein [Acidobacteriaceae bacterium]